MPHLFDELKRRNVIRVAIAYAVASWILAQVSDLAASNLNFPDWFVPMVLVVLAFGFPIVVIFAWAFEMTPGGLKKTSEMDRTRSITPGTSKKLNILVFAVMALAIVYFVFDKFMLSESDGGALGETASWSASGSGQEYPTIAVLPFVNMSSDPEQEYFSDGISEEILNVLAQVKDLRVAGRTSSFAFKGRNEDLRQIGDTLGVEHILEGSVRRSGDQVRITAQLIQVEDGFHLWSETYDRQLIDIFAIQDEISAAILQQLKAQLLNGQSIAVVRADSTAFDLYLQARQRMRERTEASLLAAVETLDKSIAADASFAPAWAQRGVAILLLKDSVGSYGSIPTKQAISQATPYLEEAIRLNPQLAEALAGMGLLHLGRNEVEEGIAYLKQALAVNPASIDALNWLKEGYITLGRIQNSLAVLEEIRLRDPMYIPGIVDIVYGYTIVGRNEEAIALLEGILPMFPDEVHDQLWIGAAHAISQHETISIAERLYASQPTQNANRLALGYLHNSIENPERTLEVAGDLPVAIAALNKLGRSEEAIRLAYTMAAEGQAVTELIGVLSNNKRYGELIEFVEQRWPDLDAFEADVPGLRQGEGASALGHIAHAYFELGQMAKYGIAMWHFKTLIDEQLEEGVSNRNFWGSQAHFSLLSGDKVKAMDFLAAIADTGTGVLLPKTLINDPRYIEIVEQLHDNLNAERAALGLEPVGT
jgi:TolB-like protein